MNSATTNRMEALLDNPRPLILGATVVLFLLYTIVSRLTAPPRVPKDVQWVGRNDKEWFAGLRAAIRSFKGLDALSTEGYNAYSKFNRLFAAPNFMIGPEVLLPHSEMTRMLQMPESVLNVKEVHDESIQQRYTINDDRVMGNFVHVDIIRRQLTRNLGNLTRVIADELAYGFQDQWGMDTENWKEVNVMDTCMEIVARTSNRVFTGAPLCRNNDYLQNCRKYSMSIVGNGMIIKNFPGWLKPLLGPIVASSCKRYLAGALKHTKPVIIERLELNERVRSDPKYANYELPNDYIQWQIDESYKRNDPIERTPEIITKRLMILNFVAIHTSTMTFSNSIFDLYSSNPADGFVEGIRDECDRVLAEDKYAWSKSAVGQLVRLDSAIKETMRHSPFGLRALQRIVKGEKGVDFGGVNLPHGTRVAFPLHSIHHDADLYPEPNRYDAFRFSRPREQWEAAKPAAERRDSGVENSAAAVAAGAESASVDKSKTSEKDLQAILEFKNSSMVTVSNDFLSFGQGKHACPGRFFASNEIKMMLAYMVQNYDVEYLAVRPDNRTLGDISAPPSANVRVRRRKQPAGTAKA